MNWPYFVDKNTITGTEMKAVRESFQLSTNMKKSVPAAWTRFLR